MTQNWKTPLLLYLATFFTTTFCRFGFDGDLLYNVLFSTTLSVLGGDTNAHWHVVGELLWLSLQFSLPLMIILTCHECGHFVQSKRYGVRSTLPYFLPIPFGLLGTLGAVIAMDDRIPNTKALFDIGISGPLAGLVPTLFFLYFGIQWSYITPIPEGDILLSDPLLMQWLTTCMYGPIPSDMTLCVHPFAMAAWTGLLLTSLNLMPFGQLDGGHIFYALVGQYASTLMRAGFFAAAILLIWFQLWHWSLLLILLAFVGITHPPTANDAMPLTWFRRCLGWATLAFIIIGFTPTPIPFDNLEPPESTKPVWYCQLEDGGNERIYSTHFEVGLPHISRMP